MAAKKKKKKKAKKKVETSKKLAWWAVWIGTLSSAASYALAAFRMESVSELSTTIFTACIGYLIAYAGKSLGEKVSRNKHGLDENGKPFDTNAKG